jgi:hypothetical protein
MAFTEERCDLDTPAHAAHKRRIEAGQGRDFAGDAVEGGKVVFGAIDCSVGGQKGG